MSTENQDDYDLVVIGSGPAGISAVLTAINRGKKVLLIEKYSRIGGTGFTSAYGMWIPNNKFLRQHNIADDKDYCMKYMCQRSHPDDFDISDDYYGIPKQQYKVLEAYYDNAAEAVESLEYMTGLKLEVMLNTAICPTNEDNMAKLLEGKGINYNNEVLRYVSDYAPHDEYNMAPLGRYITFCPDKLSSLKYVIKTCAQQGFSGFLSSIHEVLSLEKIKTFFLHYTGIKKEGSLGFMGVGISFTNKVSKVLSRSTLLHVELNAALSEILFDNNKHISGCKYITEDGVEKTVTTRKLILAMGGFAASEEHMSDKVSGVHVFNTYSVPTNTGDYFKLLSDLDIQYNYLDTLWVTEDVIAPIIEEKKYDPFPTYGLWYISSDSSIVVNLNGERCYDESMPYSLRAKYYKSPDKLATILIYDKRARKEFGGAMTHIGMGMPKSTPFDFLDPEYIIKGSSISDLAKKIEKYFHSKKAIFNDTFSDEFENNLYNTIHTYNGYAIKGNDPDFQRGENHGYLSWMSRRAQDNNYPNKYMHPLDLSEDLYAVVMGLTCFSTKGGIQINENAQVLNNDNEVIEGLYASGNCTCSPSNKDYLTSTIGPALTFGHVAAKHACQS